MSYDVNRFRELFFEEAAEHVAAMEGGLLALEAGSGDPEIVHSVFRAAHSIKGVAGSLGFTQIAEFTHLVESVLGRFRDGTLAIEAGLVSLIVTATDAMRAMIAAAASGGADVETASIAADLRRVLQVDAASPVASVAGKATPPDVTRYHVRLAPKPEFFRSGQDVMLLLRELTELASSSTIAVDASKLPALGELDPQTCHLAWTIELSTTVPRGDIDGVFIFVDDACEIEIREVPDTVVASQAPQATQATSVVEAARETAKRPEHQVAASIRVSADKVDALVDLVGEMIISQAMVNQIGARADSADGFALRDALAALERQTRELQERVMAIRMLPVETIFSRFTRLARDLSAQLGKRVSLEMSGAETELDRGMLERLGDPLTHLVRNAIDHGLESPEERRTAGKREEGSVHLRAYHESGGVVIEVSDDGRGLNTARIREKALANGLIANDRLSDDEIHQLIFAPGFSTAAAITDVSGRGVGMDVVKSTITALKGSIDIENRPGRGCTVRVRLPLTLAVLDGLVVRVAGESFVVPMTSISETLRPAERDVRDLLGRGETLELRGESLPFVRLGAVFGLSGAVEEATRGIVVVLDAAGKRFAAMVDDVLGEQQVVIKSLELNYRKVNGAMAATILGDGHVALIVDVAQLALTPPRRSTADVLALSA